MFEIHQIDFCHVLSAIQNAPIVQLLQCPNIIVVCLDHSSANTAPFCTSGVDNRDRFPILLQDAFRSTALVRLDFVVSVLCAFRRFKVRGSWRVTIS